LLRQRQTDHFIIALIEIIDNLDKALYTVNSIGKDKPTTL
jgi:RNA processing factor Prp31